MLSKDELLASILHECDVASYLVKQLPREALDARPTPGQRSNLEVARYLSFCAIGGTLCLIDGNFDGYKAWEDRQAALDIDDYDAAMGAQKAALEEAFAKLSDADLAREVKHPAGHTLRLERGLLEMPLKWMVGYRMQLFLGAKLAGNTQLGTAECWHGRPAKPKA